MDEVTLRMKGSDIEIDCTKSKNTCDLFMATEGGDIEIEKDGGGDTLHGVEEEREEEEENASEREDEVDEEGEEKEDGGYTFRFENGMNPLDFLSDSGVQCYQKLQQHENEALANKKRKSPEQFSTSERNEGISFKKAREDDISEEKCAEVMEAMSIGGGRRSRKRKQPKKRGRQKGSKKKLDERLSKMLLTANIHYSKGRYNEAIKLLHEVLRLEPNLPDSYHILGLVHTELGNCQKGMDFYMFAAKLTPKDSTLWRRLFVWSIEQDNTGQANYCLERAIDADPKDSSLLIHHALLHAEVQDFHKAAMSYEKVYRLCPENVDALKSAAKAHHCLRKYFKQCSERLFRPM